MFTGGYAPWLVERMATKNVSLEGRRVLAKTSGGASHALVNNAPHDGRVLPTELDRRLPPSASRQSR